MKLTKRDWNKLKSKRSQIGSRRAVKMSRLPKKKKPGGEAGLRTAEKTT